MKYTLQSKAWDPYSSSGFKSLSKRQSRIVHPEYWTHVEPQLGHPPVTFRGGFRLFLTNIWELTFIMFISWPCFCQKLGETNGTLVHKAPKTWPYSLHLSSKIQVFISKILPRSLERQPGSWHTTGGVFIWQWNGAEVFSTRLNYTKGEVWGVIMECHACFSRFQMCKQFFRLFSPKLLTRILIRY